MIQSSGSMPVVQPYSLLQYTIMFEKASHELKLIEIEKSTAFRSANGIVDGRTTLLKTQTRALYGRIKTTAAHFLLHSIAQLKPESIICDLGHGVGNLVIQAAYTIGCESRGIELVQARHEVAETLRAHFLEHNPVCFSYSPFRNYEVSPPHIHFPFSRCLLEEAYPSEWEI